MVKIVLSRINEKKQSLGPTVIGFRGFHEVMIFYSPGPASPPGRYQ